MDYQYEMILCIVNAGFSDAVMDTARKLGAGGGTVIHARGTASKEAEALFRITVQPEKEMVMIVVPKEKKTPILAALYDAVGLETPGQGIAFSLPVDEAVGLSSAKPPKAEKEPKDQREQKESKDSAEAK